MCRIPIEGWRDPPRRVEDVECVHEVRRSRTFADMIGKCQGPVEETTNTLRSLSARF